MFERWGRAVARLRWLVVGLFVALLAFAGAWGTGVFGSLANGGFEDPGSESYRATQRIEQAVGRQDVDVLAIYTSADRTVDDPALRSAVERSLDALPAGEVTRASTFWSTGSPAFVSADRRATYAALQLEGATAAERMASYQAVSDALHEVDLPGLTVTAGGRSATEAALNTQISEDLARAESLSLPILLVLLVVVFGSVVAAGLPLGIGIVAVLGSFTVLRLLTLVTDVSVFAINIITLLGLGLAIDYALFVVSRFREEIRNDRTVPDALARTMATAGRTVAFSGVTVAISLAGLALFPQAFLRSMAYGGVAAVLIAMLTALTLLPAVLAILGRRVDAWSFAGLARRLGRRPADAVPAEPGARWARVAGSVMRRPGLYAVGVTAVLLALAAPFLGVRFGGVDSRMLPAGAESRQAEALLHDRFPGVLAAPIDVLVETAPGTSAAAATAGVRDRVAALDGVTAATVTTQRGDSGVVSVSYEGGAVDAGPLQLVRDIRALDLPPGATALVGGTSAEQVDLRASLVERLPWTAGVILLATTLLLFAAFGSLVLPLKAVIMNVLSMTAAFGVVVWIFQNGHFAGPLGFTSTGTIETTQPILMLAILFGLSMDYEVFLLSRIRERYDVTHDTTDAVVTGVARTGRIITSAALLLVVVVGAFSTSGVTFIKMIGVGMAVAIVLDATIVRGLLVPATLRLLGDATWWAPAPMRRWYERHGIGERDDLDEPAAPPRAPLEHAPA
jgi:RND superfamily putative drug exporter